MPFRDASKLNSVLDGADEHLDSAAAIAGGHLPDGGSEAASCPDESANFVEEGLCVECEAPAALRCEQCEDQYCAVCFQALHRKGKRAKHTATPVFGPVPTVPTKMAAAAAFPSPTAELVGSLEMYSPAWFAERAKYIPMRLTMSERKGLRLLQSALKVCDYTDKIDGTSNRSKAKRIQAQTRSVCALLSGLVVAVNYDEGQDIIESRDFVRHESFFRSVFEVGRRHKIMNPDSMRDEYGKAIYFLQVRRRDGH